jgi:hypothetical protein
MPAFAPVERPLAGAEVFDAADDPVAAAPCSVAVAPGLWEGELAIDAPVATADLYARSGADGGSNLERSVDSQARVTGSKLAYKPFMSKTDITRRRLSQVWVVFKRLTRRILEDVFSIQNGGSVVVNCSDFIDRRSCAEIT